MKKILLICNHFPPSDHVGAKRPGWIAKYLPDYGWQPIVITSEKENVSGSTFFNRDGVAPAPIIHQIRGRFWILRATARGLSLIWRERISVVYSTFPNSSALWIGWLTTVFSRAIWVCEFRDPWTLQYRYRNPLRKGWDAFVERQFIRRAHHIVSIGHVLKAHLQSISKVADSKISVIYNGYERKYSRADSPAASANTRPSPLRIGYFGSFDAYADPRPFFKGLARLLNDRPDFRERIVCDFVDSFEFADQLREDCHRFINENDLTNSIRWLPKAPYAAGMARLNECNALLLIVGGPEKKRDHLRLIVTGKVFDYIALGKIILAFVPADGEAAEIVRGTGRGIVGPAENEIAIAQALEDAVLRLDHGLGLTPEQQEVADRFDIRWQMKQLSIVLNKLVRCRGESQARARLKQSMLRAFFFAGGVLYAPWKLWRRAQLKTADLKNILVLASHSGLGNTILLLPFLSVLKDRFPKAKITMLVRSGASAELLRNQTMVDDVIHLPTPSGLSFRDEIPLLQNLLQGRRFDLAVSTFLEPYPENVLRALLARASYRISFNQGVFGLLDTFTLKSDPERHEVDNHLLIASVVGIKRKSSVPVVSIPLDARTFAGDYLTKRHFEDKAIIGIHAGSDTATQCKRWPLEKFMHVVEEIQQKSKDARFLFFCGPEDKSLGVAVEALRNETIHVVAGLTVSQIAALISRCQVFLSNDSGLMHLAASVGVPTVAVFGPTIPTKNAPVGAGHVIVRETLPCSPCYDWRLFREVEGRTVFAPPCDGTMECLQGITAVRVAEEVLKKLKSDPVFVESGKEYSAIA